MAFADEEVVVTVTGLDALGAQLDKLDLAIQTRIMRHALKHAADVFVEPMRAKAPISTDAVSEATHTTRLVRGMLKASIRTKVDMGNEQGPTAFAGPDKRTQHVANWVENGFNLTTHGRKKDRKVIRHIAPAHPFVRPTFDAYQNQAIEAFATALMDGINVEIQQAMPTTSEAPEVESEAA